VKPLNLILGGQLNKGFPVLLVIPLVLSCFTHMWNLTGFPAIYMDEDIYIRKALHALEGLPLEPDKTNPLYGWLFLAVVLKAVGYPDSLHLNSDPNLSSIEVLYLVPRLFIGVLAILDTFLIFKITQYHFKNNTVALVASILFAVMPMTWLTRYVLLESIQLPFLLTSILFAVYPSNNSNNKMMGTLPIILFSGICFGSAIFIKIPALTLAPLIGYIIYKNIKSVKTLALWFIPVILIPLISPAYAASLGMFNTWSEGIFYQANRGNQPLFDLSGQNPSNAINALMRIDPILLVAGLICIFYIAIRRDFLLILWVAPYIIFFYFLDYVSFFHFIPILPAFCIAFAKPIVDLSSKLWNKKLGHFLPYVIISAIGIFGLTSITLLLSTYINATHFEAATIITNILPHIDKFNDQPNRTTVIVGESRFLWIIKDVFHRDHIYKTYWNDESPINKTKGVILLLEGTYDYWKRTDRDKNHVKELLNIYNDSHSVVVLNKNIDDYDTEKYPFTSMSIGNLGIGRVEIRANSEATKLFMDKTKHDR
jgi:hypothetical protein